MDQATEARNALITIVTAARSGEMELASRLTNEFSIVHGGDILPLLISAVGLIETIIQTVAKELEMESDALFAGICLGLTVRQAAEKEDRD